MSQKITFAILSVITVFLVGIVILFASQLQQQEAGTDAANQDFSVSDDTTVEFEKDKSETCETTDLVTAGYGDCGGGSCAASERRTGAYRSTPDGLYICRDVCRTDETCTNATDLKGDDPDIEYKPPIYDYDTPLPETAIISPEADLLLLLGTAGIAVGIWLSKRNQQPQNTP